MNYMMAKGWLRPEEREELKRLAKKHATSPGSVIINIGVEFGASIACLRAGASSANILGIDLDMSKLDPEVYRQCTPLLQEGDSHDPALQKRVFALAKWYVGGVGMVFIDGDHTRDGVAADTIYCDLVRPGGVAVFHDCYDFDNPETRQPNPVCPGVGAAVDDWSDRHAQWVELGSVGTMRIFQLGRV